MMKKLILFVAMAIVSVMANAQDETGKLTIMPKVGVGFSDLPTEEVSSRRTGLVIGAEAELGSEEMSMSLGIMYSMQGLKIKDATQQQLLGEVWKLDYINIPLIYKFYLYKGLAIGAGIQLGILVNKGIDYKGKTYKYEDKNLNPKTFDFSIPLGISYEYKNIVADLRANMGATKVFGDEFSDRNNSIQFTVGYKFTLYDGTN